MASRNVTPTPVTPECRWGALDSLMKKNREVGASQLPYPFSALRWRPQEDLNPCRRRERAGGQATGSHAG